MKVGDHAAGYRANRRQKGIVMFEKVEVPVLGIVENMVCIFAWQLRPSRTDLRHGRRAKLAEKYHTQLLGQMPLHDSLREDLDRVVAPTVVSRPEARLPRSLSRTGRQRCGCSFTGGVK